MLTQMFYSMAQGGEPLRSDSGADFWGMVLRIALFLLALLVFVFVCGLAWRTLPGLKAILPEPPQPRRKLEGQITLSDEILAEIEGEAPYSAELDEALADNRPGAVIRATGDPDQQPSSPIITYRRAEK